MLQLFLGALHVSGSLDREKHDVYHLSVVVTDGKNENQTAVTVKIEDINDNPPQFNQSSIVVRVLEEQDPISFYTVEAYDLDQRDTNNSRISFSLQKDNGLC